MYCDDGVVEFWENQRFWGLTWGTPLLPFDWPAWSDSQGNAVHLARPPEREGERNWFVVRTLGTDEEGWRYSTVFSKITTPRPGGRASKRSSDYVRSRVWRKLIAEAIPLPPDQELQSLSREPLVGGSPAVGGARPLNDGSSTAGFCAAAAAADGDGESLPAVATSGAAGAAAAAAAATAAGVGVASRPRSRLQPEAERILLSAVAAASINNGRGGAAGGGSGALPKPSLFKLWQLFMELWNDACARHGMRRLVPLDPLGLYVAARRHRELLARQRLAQLAAGRLVAAAPVATEVEPDLLDEQPYGGDSGDGGGGQGEQEDVALEAREQSAAALGGLRRAAAAGAGEQQAAAAAVAAAAAAAAEAAAQHRSPTVGETPTGAAIMLPAAPQAVTLRRGGGSERRTMSITGPGAGGGNGGGAAAAAGRIPLATCGSGETVLSADQGLMPDLTDPTTLLSELVTATNYARAAYGYVMAAGHLNSLTKLLTMLSSSAHFNPITGASAEANLEAIHLFTGIPVEDVVMAEWRSSVFRPCHYLAVDRRRRRLVLAVRGSLELADIATDLTARPVEYDFGGGLVGHVHQGLMSAASYVQLNTAAALQSAAERFPGWPLLVTGHSLGAGVAALLTLLLLQRDRPMSAPAAVPIVHCLAIAPPAVLSANLAEAARRCCVSVVNQGDFVARLSCYSVDRALLELVQASPAAQMADNLLQSTGATWAAIQQRLAALGGAAAGGGGGGGGGFLAAAGLARFNAGSHPDSDRSAPNIRGMELEMVAAAGLGTSRARSGSVGLGAGGGGGDGGGGGWLPRQQLGSVLQPPPPSLASAAAVAASKPGCINCAGLKDIPLLTADTPRHHHHHHPHHQHHHTHHHHGNVLRQPQPCQLQQDLQTNTGSPFTTRLSGGDGGHSSHHQRPVVQPRAAADASYPLSPPPLPPLTIPPVGGGVDEGAVGVPVSDDDEGGGGDCDDDDDSLSVYTAGSVIADSGLSFPSGMSYHSAASRHGSYISASSSPVSLVSVSPGDAADAGFLYRAVHPADLVLPPPPSDGSGVRNQPGDAADAVAAAATASVGSQPHPRDRHGHHSHHHHSHHHPHRHHHQEDRDPRCHATAAGLAAAAAAAAVGGVPYAHASPPATAARPIPSPAACGGRGRAHVVPRGRSNRFAPLTPPTTSPAGGAEELLAAAAAANGWGLRPDDGAAAALAPEAPRRRSDPLAGRGPLHSWNEAGEGPYGARDDTGVPMTSRDLSGSGGRRGQGRLGGVNGGFGSGPRPRRTRSRSRLDGERGGGGGGGTESLMSWEALSQKLMTSWFGQGFFDDEGEEEEEEDSDGTEAARRAAADAGGGGGGFGSWWLSAMTGAQSGWGTAQPPPPPPPPAGGAGGNGGMTSCWPGLEEPPGPHRAGSVGAALRGKYGAPTHGSGAWPWAEALQRRPPSMHGAPAAAAAVAAGPQAQQRLAAPAPAAEACLDGGAGGGGGGSLSRPAAPRSLRHRVSRSVPAAEMPDVADSMDADADASAEAAADEAATSAGGGDSGPAPAPHYLHSVHKELYPPGRLLWMVVDEVGSLPPELRRTVPTCGFSAARTSASDDGGGNGGAVGAAAGAAAGAAPSARAAAAGAAAGAAPSAALAMAKGAGAETCTTMGGADGAAAAAAPAAAAAAAAQHVDCGASHPDARVREVGAEGGRHLRGGASEVQEEGEQQSPASDEAEKGYSLLDLSLVTDLMQGLAAGPGSVAAPLSSASVSAGALGRAAVDAPPSPSPSPSVDNVSRRAAATEEDESGEGEGEGEKAAGAEAQLSGRSSPSALVPTASAGSKRQRVSFNGARVEEQVEAAGERQLAIRQYDRGGAAGGGDAWRTELATAPSSLPAVAAVDGCAASVAVAVAEMTGGGGGGGSSLDSGGGGGAGVTPFSARVREGLKRIKSGVETMLRQAPLPSVTSMSFLPGSSPPAATTGADGSAHGGGRATSTEHGGGGGGGMDADGAVSLGFHFAGQWQQQQQQGEGPSHQGQWVFLVEADREVFDRMILIPSCVTDHLPDAYFQRLRQLAKGSTAAAAAAAAAATAVAGGGSGLAGNSRRGRDGGGAAATVPPGL